MSEETNALVDAAEYMNKLGHDLHERNEFRNNQLGKIMEAQHQDQMAIFRQLSLRIDETNKHLAAISKAQGEIRTILVFLLGAAIGAFIRVFGVW